METSQSADQQQRDAEREAEQGAAIARGKAAAAARQSEARAAHAAELARRKAADASMGIPHHWPETRKAAARAKYADSQRAARVEAERAANPPKPTPLDSLSRDSSPAAILLKLQRGTMQPGMPFPNS